MSAEGDAVSSYVVEGGERVVEAVLPSRGRSLLAQCDVEAGELLLRERPIACAQFSWNKLCKYKACDHCLRSLETPTAMARRLSGHADIELPFEKECSPVDPSAHCVCDDCGEAYCSAACRDAARATYHQQLCTRGAKEHPLSDVDDLWRQIHPPPETTSVMLFIRLLVRAAQVRKRTEWSGKDSLFVRSSRAPRATARYRNFAPNHPKLHIRLKDADDAGAIAKLCCAFERQLTSGPVRHKLTESRFAEGLDSLQREVTRLMDQLGLATHPNVGKWLEPSEFLNLWALAGTNGAGIGTSSMAQYDQRLSALDMPDDDRERCDSLMEQVYEWMHEESGHFLDVEGSGIFALHSACNHSCEPNAEVAFEGDSTLTLRALEDIAQGDEICISYLEPGLLRSSRNTRHAELRENYLFDCDCPKCQRQVEEPDLSDPESEEDEDDEAGHDHE